MIVGIGNDIVNITRIETLIKRFKMRFLTRILTPNELNQYNYIPSPTKAAAFVAKRFAAKEACAKALGTGIRGFKFTDIEVSNTEEGKPTLTLHNQALIHLLKLTSTPLLHLSLSDDHPVAIAMVIIEA